MYECPITTYIDEAINAINQEIVEQENAIAYKITETIGIEVNREELIKALKYDRDQYEKGYADAKAEMKWTKVEDGLPDLHKDSLLTHRKRSDEVMCKIKADEDLINSCGYLVEDMDGHKEWQTDCYMADGDEVTAWMPIPKYEGVE